MTTLLSRTFLESIGIFLDDTSYQALSTHFETELEERIINEIIQELSPDQAEQLATFKGKGDDDMYRWLVANVPSLPEIVSDEIDILLGEIAGNAEQFTQ